jgi:hypothetical protein
MTEFTDEEFQAAVQAFFEELKAAQVEFGFVLTEEQLWDLYAD